MRENAGIMQTRITPNTDTFYAVCVTLISLFIFYLLTLIMESSSNEIKGILELNNIFDETKSQEFHISNQDISTSFNK